MNVFRFRTINKGYQELVRTLLSRPNYYQSVQFAGSGKGKFCNKKSRYHLRNVHIMFEEPSDFTRFEVHCPVRTHKMNMYMNREQQLFDRGVTDATLMGSISQIWKLISNPDNTINANYGYMVYHLRDAGHPQFTPKNMYMSQWEWCQNRLINNPYTLQAIMHFNRPKDQFPENLDQPCTVFTQFTVEDDENGTPRINFHSYMRSNDIIYGTPYNLAYFVTLQRRMRSFLNENRVTSIPIEMGYLHHNVTSLHLYEDKIRIAEAITGITR